jgi:recombination protein RecA
MGIRTGTPWLTLLCRLILNAQTSGEPVAWITLSKDTFYPPDFNRNGVDLSRLPVIFAPDARYASRSAEHLVRSGAFGLVILQVDTERISNAALGRLARLADQYSSAVLVLTSTGQPSQGSLISLRMACRVRQESVPTAPYTGNRFICELVVTKDKRNGPGRVYTETCYGLPGLC